MMRREIRDILFNLQSGALTVVGATDRICMLIETIKADWSEQAQKRVDDIFTRRLHNYRSGLGGCTRGVVPLNRI